MQSGQSGRVTDGVTVEKRREDELETGVVGSGKAGVNMSVGILVILDKSASTLKHES